jgi:hypothetical protein
MNVLYTPIWNCHNESLLYDGYIIIFKKIIIRRKEGRKKEKERKKKKRKGKKGRNQQSNSFYELTCDNTEENTSRMYPPAH